MPSREDLFKGFTIGEWEVLPGQGVLRRGQEVERPEPKVFEVLMVLAGHDGNLVTRDGLVAEVWDGRPTTDEPINRCLSQLRGHLDDRKRPHQYVETLQRRGYRLMKPVELHVQPDSTKPSRRRSSSLRLWRTVAAIMALGFLASIALTMRTPEPDPDIRSIAILPIENLSGDPANQYIVDGIKNVLARRLSEVPELSIKNTRVRYDMEPSEIAETLDVESVMTGAVQLQGTTLKLTYLVTRGNDNVTIGSGEVNGDLSGIYSLQERLAAIVLNELMGSATPELITSYTPDSEAYNSYMRGVYAFERRGDADNLENAIALFRESIEMDRYYGPAYLSLATAYALQHYYDGSSPHDSSRLAIETVEKGIAVDSNIEDAAGEVYGIAYHWQKRWSKSEAAYRRAVSARVMDSIAFNWYSRMLSSVGRLDEALAQALAAEAIDPDNPVINSRIAIVYTWLGDAERAHEFFQRSDDLGATGTIHLLAYALLLLREDRLEEATQIAVAASELANVSPAWVEPVFAAFRDRSLSGPALEALDQASAEDTLKAEVQVTARTVLGDVDGAMKIALQLEEPGEYFQMDLLFAPELRPLREHPGFLPLLERLGVVNYWNEAGCDFDGDKAVCADN